MLRRFFSSRKGLSKVSIIPVPINFGQPNTGVDSGPRSLLECGLVDAVKQTGWEVDVSPTLSFNHLDSAVKSLQNPPTAKGCAKLGEASRIICDHVSSHSQGDVFPLILGGDHSVAIGTIAGIKKNRPNNCIIWVDAHADINTPDTTGSGNMHGMPLGFLLGLVKNMKNLPNFGWMNPCVKPNEIVYIGLRDLDRGEQIAIRQLGIKSFTMYEVDKLGIGKVMEETLDHCGKNDIHLSFDIDAIDPMFAPHTGTAVNGGLTFREGNFICETLAESGRLASMEMVEVDPMIHKDVNPRKTIDCAISLISSALGKRIL